MEFKEFLDKILNAYHNNKRIVIFNVGSSSVLYDSFGPMVGSLLKEMNIKNLKIIGDLDNNANALTIEKKYKRINRKKDFIIALDACIVYEEEKINKILLIDGSVSPGEGVGKNIKSIGNISIKYGVKKEELEHTTNLRIEHVYNNAKIIANFIKSIDSIIELEKTLLINNINNDRKVNII